MSNVADLTQENKQKTVQIILKVPEAFLKRFDKTSGELGYTRTEAIREAMRRFQQDGEKKVMERPETIAENMGKMMTEAWKPVIDMVRQAEETKSRRVITMRPEDKKT